MVKRGDILGFSIKELVIIAGVSFVGYIIYKGIFSKEGGVGGASGASPLVNFFEGASTFTTGASEFIGGATSLAGGITKGIGEDLNTGGQVLKEVAIFAPAAVGIEPFQTIRKINNPIIDTPIGTFHGGTTLLGIGGGGLGFDVFPKIYNWAANKLGVGGNANMVAVATAPSQNVVSAAKSSSGSSSQSTTSPSSSSSYSSGGSKMFLTSKSGQLVYGTPIYSGGKLTGIDTGNQSVAIKQNLLI